MTQKKLKKPTSQNFKRLLKASTAEEILNALTTCCWEADGNEGDPPISTFEELQNFNLPTEKKDNLHVHISDSHYELYATNAGLWADEMESFRNFLITKEQQDLPIPLSPDY